MGWDEDDALLVQQIRDALRDIAKRQASIAADVRRFVDAAERNEAEAVEVFQAGDHTEIRNVAPRRVQISVRPCGTIMGARWADRDDRATLGHFFADNDVREFVEVP